MLYFFQAPTRAPAWLPLGIPQQRPHLQPTCLSTQGVSQLCLGCPGKVAAWSWEDLKGWLGGAGRKASCRSYVRAPASPSPAGWPNFRTTITFEGQANFRPSLITGSFKALMMVLWWKRGWFLEPEMSEKWCSGHDQGKVAWPVGTAGQS